MNCECNNKSNRVKPGIKHVYGNVLRMAIPLTLRTLVKDGDEMNVTDTDFVPSSDHPVRVVLSKGKTKYPIIATMDGNVAIVEDKGKIPVGTYDISVECYDDLGNPYRFKQNAVLYVADTTAEAGIDEEIEYEAQTWYLNAAVFLATTEIGEIGDAIDAKLDDVFGNVAYDANAKEIRFYNKGNSRVLATIDSRPFITDGTVADVYIDVSRQVLVVVLNEDAGGRMFSVPLYLIFNSYYKKDEVDSLLSNTVKGLRFDFSQELPLVVPVTKNGSSISSTVDFGAIDNAIREDGRIVVACVNNSEFYQLLDANRAEIAFTRVVALDGYQELLIVDPHNVWSMEDVNLGTGGGGGYEPPAGGIPKTDLAPAVQASLDLADSALQPSDLEGYATTDDVDDAVATLVSSAPQTLDTLKELADALGDDPNFATTMATQLGNKVDKETGKGLSTNDYTTAEKTKLAGLENYDDSALQTAVSGKVDKESGKSLMTDAERTKLQGIAAGAEVNVQPNWTQTNTSADDYIKNKPDLSTFATKTEVNAKQDKINDLAAIRSGAAKGATSVQTVSVNGASLSPTDGNISISAVTGLQFDGSTHVGAVQLPEYVKKSDYDTTIDDIYQSIPSDLADMADDATHRLVTDTEKNTWNGKQNAISDLATIRSGAALGATAAQPADLPTKVSDLQNDSGFITSSDINAAKPLVVTLGYSNGAYTCDTSNADIYTAWSNGRDVIANADGGYIYHLCSTPTLYKVMFSGLMDELGRELYIVSTNSNVQTVTYFYDSIQQNLTFDNSPTQNSNNPVKSGGVYTALAAKANSSDLAAVATSGSYNDLSNKPTIPAAQVNADWNATSGVSRILNKPTIPTVPTKVSSFTNDAGYLTQHQSLANYYTKSEIDTKIGNIETLLASI